jgi:prepilin peptidase CpaA
VNEPTLDAVPLAVLALLLGLATWHDVRSRRIPNQLILVGAIAGLLAHVFWPQASSLTGAALSGKGALFSLAGFGLGLLLLMPFYVLRTMGAGDVKLVAMTGAFLGPAAVAGATVLTMLCGGVLALVVACWNRQLLQVLANVRAMLFSMAHRLQAGTNAAADPPPAPTGKLAYAIAISCGTGLQLALAGSPAWRLFS